MGFNCGIVGLPNVGKSTLFNALTKAGIAAENFPFCTKDPNTGVVPVPDARLKQLAQIVKPERTIATSMEFVDIAGLVAGASKGEGMGNQFLANIRETDAIAHVVRCFDDDNVIHVDGRVNPLSDIETINTELALADLEAVTRAITNASKKAKGGDKEAKAILDVFNKIEPLLADGKPARMANLDDDASSSKFAMRAGLPSANNGSILLKTSKMALASLSPPLAFLLALVMALVTASKSAKASSVLMVSMSDSGLTRPST